ncbi:GAF domain-containing protein [Bradyrhizobium sp. WD16]|uniref:GAF domain-containing protein n=1 Tax=Bradyrhizobium sp. WD16 TaxID=1521768 RepID=UPI0020A30B0E|nr:GAF domain-containing protein [Bradyrhizobium sp. WD16]UTD27936.1 GAF domain-containing protein [Bradyrhizobium sp. WD16]
MQPLSLSHVADLAAAQIGGGQPTASLQAIERVLAEIVGVRLFTVLVHDPVRGFICRAYSNMPEAYPVGGTKPINDTPWMRRVLSRGEAYIGRDRDDIRDVFFDYELIWSLGCESVLNLPVRWDATVIGTLNLLHAAHWYDTVDPSRLDPLVQYAVPALLTMKETL